MIFLKKMYESIIEKIKEIAKEEDVVLIQHQENIKLLILTNGVAQFNVYYSKMTVGTSLNHPSQGKTQLFRKNISFSELREIFKNARVHTGKGYQKNNFLK